MGDVRAEIRDVLTRDVTTPSPPAVAAGPWRTILVAAIFSIVAGVIGWSLRSVCVQAFPNPGAKWQISTDGGGGPIWSPDGRELFYGAGGHI